MPQNEREIKYKFSATENVTSVAGRVEQALKGARKSDAAQAVEEIGKLARGAGVLAGFAIIGQAASDMARNIAEIRVNAEQGANTWGDYAEAIGRGLPVIGGMVAGIRDLRKELDGTAQLQRDAEKRKAITEAISGQVSSVQADANTSGKRGIGLARAQAENELKAKIAAVETVRREHAKDLTLSDNKALDRVEEEMRRQSRANLIKIEVEYYEQLARVAFEGESRVNDERAKLRAGQARFVGKDLEARLIEIKAERDATVRSIIQQTTDAQKATDDPEEKARLGRERGVRGAIAERNRVLQENIAREEDEKAQRERRAGFQKLGIEFLQKEFDLGKAGVAVEAEKLQIAADYAAKRQEIADALKRENISADERALLRGLRDRLDEQEQTALAQVGKARPRFSGGVAPTPGNDFYTTGLAAAARENDPAYRTAENTAETNRLLGDLTRKLTPTNTNGGASDTYTVK